MLRVIATLAVILNHVCGTVLTQDLAAATGTQNMFYNIAMNCVHWHVPVFFMMTGMLMLDSHRQITPAICMRRYALRFALALLLFGVPFSFIKIVFEAKTVSVQMIPQALVDMLAGDTFDHLWYLYCLVGLYLFMPLFKFFTDSVSKSVFRYTLLVLLACDFCLPLFESVTHLHIALASPVSYPVFYLLLGAYLSRWTPALFRNRMLCLAGVAAMIPVAALNYVFSPKGVHLCDYTSPLVALGSCCAFCLIRGLHIPDKWQRPLWRLDRLCFGAYLVHPVFIHTVYRGLHILPSSFKAYPLVTFAFFVVFAALSFFASWVMSLIPPLKKYVL